jgi:acyl carrier protein
MEAMMTDAEIRQLALDVLASVAPEAELTGLDPAVNFRDQVEIDSLDFLNFILALEERLGVSVAESDYPKLSNLNGCVAYVRDSLEGRAAS